ncbi:hypothetical protein [Qipengyuania sp.]|uniref:hypothetical protein n=1 Tax=Qipengyuania sp. TaxID=2004515 RepID=UPI0035C7BC50
MKNTIGIALASAGLLALSACGEPDADDTAMDTPATEMTTETTMMDDAYPVGGDMNETQQAAYDSMDWQAVSDEYDANTDAMMQESASGGGTMSGDTQNSSSEQTTNGNEDSSVMTMPPRAEMDFAFLDRNDDGKLSTAEYAIWAVPANPTKPKPNDATKPYLTQDQINKAGQTFFYFDQDGDTYLQPEEFQNARTSAVTPS